ncbi:MAG: YeeE/YedE family protein [Stellaceae bacterium]
MDHFTPISAAIGGALIGLSVTMLMLANGRLAGISGIFGNVLAPQGREWRWEIAFLVGLVAAPLIIGAAGFAMPHPVMPMSWGLVAVGGVLVGFGSRLGGGCTSGHGVCGIARLSSRSIVATLIFMATAIAVVAILRHVVGGVA